MPKIFLVIPPGLEEIASREFKKLNEGEKISKINAQPTIFPELMVNWKMLFRVNRELRVPNRILVRLEQFRAVNFPELVKKTARLPWEDYLNPDIAISLRTTCKKSRLYHSDAVSERIHTAIQNRMGQKIDRIEAAGEDDTNIGSQLVVTRIFHDEVTISLDSSGMPLHRRGYRLAGGKAPLRENLAAGILLASGWEPGQTLIDPFCGAGTIPIEAAMIQSGIQPGLQRQFMFENWPIYQKLLIPDPTFDQETALSNKDSFNLFGSDRDENVLKMAFANSQRAGVDHLINWQHRAFSYIKPFDGPGWIITNPPYGLRVSKNQELRNLYAQFGNVLRSEFGGWQLVFLCSDDALAQHTGFKLKTLLSFSNGGIPTKAFYAKIPN